MKIDRGYQFTRDTIASILTSGLLGEVYIGLDVGGDTQMLADGGKIAKTQSAIVLEKLIGQFLFDKASGPPAPTSGNAAPASGATPPPPASAPGSTRAGSCRARTADRRPDP